MKTYKVTIEETLRKTVEVEAENPGSAICKVEDEYNACEHALSSEDFVGADIALSMEDDAAISALNNSRFVEFVEQRYTDMHSEIDIKDKVVAAFGSLDNALYDYNEHREYLKQNRPQVYLLYRGDAWLSTSSLELLAVFTSFEKVVEYLRRKKKAFRLNSDDLKQFEINHQTQGLTPIITAHQNISMICRKLNPNDRPKMMHFIIRNSYMAHRALHEANWKVLPYHSAHTMLRTSRWKRLSIRQS